MILYDNVCTPCARKREWRELRRFAVKNKLTLTRIDVSRNHDKREEAAKYEIDLPFIVHGNVALKLGEPLEGLL